MKFLIFQEKGKEMKMLNKLTKIKLKIEKEVITWI